MVPPTRRDIDHAHHTERPGDDDYARYIRLAVAYRDVGYDDTRHRSASEFAVVDPLFNALWAWSEEALVEIAEAVGGLVPIVLTGLPRTQVDAISTAHVTPLRTARRRSHRRPELRPAGGGLRRATH